MELTCAQRAALTRQIEDRSMIKVFVPIEDEVTGWDDRQHESLRWYLLIREMEEFRRKTGKGLGWIWGMVSNGRYAEAREEFDGLLADRVRWS